MRRGTLGQDFHQYKRPVVITADLVRCAVLATGSERWPKWQHDVYMPLAPVRF